MKTVENINEKVKTATKGAPFNDSNNTSTKKSIGDLELERFINIKTKVNEIQDDLKNKANDAIATAKTSIARPIFM